VPGSSEGEPSSSDYAKNRFVLASSFFVLLFCLCQALVKEGLSSSEGCEEGSEAGVPIGSNQSTERGLHSPCDWHQAAVTALYMRHECSVFGQCRAAPKSCKLSEGSVVFVERMAIEPHNIP